MPPDPASPDKLSIIVFSGAFEKVHYALAMAAAAAASNKAATLFFTMGASRALLADDGWAELPVADPSFEAASARALDETFMARGVVGFEEILASCVALEVRFMVCEMGLRALALENARLRDDVEIHAGGLVTFLADASADGAIIFV